MPQYKKVFDVGTYAGVSGYTRVGIPTLRTPGSGGKQVAKSLRFRSANSAYLRRTFSLGNRQTWTWSAWVKRGTLGSSGVLFESFGPGGFGVDGIISFNSANILDFIFDYNGGSRWQLTTTQVFRDPSAWYHIVVVADTTNATSGDRLRIYVNGSRVTVFSTANYPSSGANGTLNQAYAHGLGADTTPATYFDGYMSEVYFIDGSALDPTSFGEYNSDNIWVPKAYSGSFAGTNSFYLDFSDVGTTTAGGANTGYGKDLSGKGTPNNWTTNNFGTTSTATTYDSMYDTPTDYDNSVYGAGNYAVLNPLKIISAVTLSNANLGITLSASTTLFQQAFGTIGVSSGKWYFEFVTASITGSGGGQFSVGVAKAEALNNVNNFTSGNAWLYYGANGFKYNTSGSAYGATFGVNEVIGVAIDMDAGKIWFSKNNTWQASGDPVAGTNAAFTNLAGNTVVPILEDDQSNDTKVGNINFGQRPFSYTPPTGFKALNTKNITRPTDANMWFYGDTPDLMWIKNRTATSDHSLTDTVRGVGLGLSSNTTGAEQGAQDVAEMNKFGMTLIGASSRTTAASNNFVYWAWKGGSSQSSIAVNAYGSTPSIASTVSANTSAGFSVVTYTGNGTAGATVGHGLGAIPSMIIVKNRTASATSWNVYQSSIPSGNLLSLNSTAASFASTNRITAVSSTTFSIGTDSDVNGSTNNHVAYCFAAVAGYSAFGSYTGNGLADGPFVYTGFRVKWLMVKRYDTGSTSNWQITHTGGSYYNGSGQGVYANLTQAEGTGVYHDLLSNGFKVKTNDGDANTLNGTYIYAAFAEHPFKIARAR